MMKCFILCIVILTAGCSQYFTLRTSQEIYKKTTFDSIDLKQVKDGTYTGYYDMLLVNAFVKVTISNGVIISLDLLEHRYNRTYDGSAVVKQILEKQSLDVDGVTGATYSSKSIIKATERALKCGM
jgi:uncharacterized protein with FMN-binding domain